MALEEARSSEAQARTRDWWPSAPMMKRGRMVWRLVRTMLRCGSGFARGSSLLELLDLLDYGLPTEADAEGGGAVDEELVEEGSAHASAGSCGEGCLSAEVGAVSVEEADSAEGGAFG